MTALIPLPVVLPLFAAGLALVLGRSARAQRVVSLAALSLVVVVGAILLAQADAHGPQVMDVGGWVAPIGISLVADRLSALMLLVSAVVALAVLVYSLGQGVVEYGRDTPLSVYHPTFLVLVAGVSNAFLSGDLFNLYVGFEILLAASYVLLTLGGTGARIRAGSTYVVVSLISSITFLAAIAMIYAATGTVNLAQLAGRLDALPDDISLVLQLLLLTAFAIKAAVFPLSAWLPDSYPTAPAPVTAVFAGLLTKVGVYAIIRTQTLLFGDSPLTDLLMWAALLTMIVGILGAVAQSDIKRMLSFTLVSHIGYMIFGVALASIAGLSGAIFYVVHHITIQTTLFLVAGLIERRGGSTSLDKLGGLARLAPVLAVLFFIPAMNLAGVPPFSGFLGKLGLMQAGIDDGSGLALLLVVGSVVTSLLTLYAIAKAWNRAFWQTAPAPLVAGEPSARDARPSGAGASGVEPDDAGPNGAEARRAGSEDAGSEDAGLDDAGLDDAGAVRVDKVGAKVAVSASTGTGKNLTDLHGKPVRAARPEVLRTPGPDIPMRVAMAVPAAVLVILGAGLTLVAGPLFGLTDRAATDLLERTPYINAVLPEGSGLSGGAELSGGAGLSGGAELSGGAGLSGGAP